MATTIRAVFDGEVLHPEDAAELQLGVTYVVIREVDALDEAADDAEPGSEEPYALAEIGRLAVDMGIEDFAARHDWYIHGTPPDDESR